MLAIVVVSVCALGATLLLFYISIRSMNLIDRLSDKILSFTSPTAFATYGASTPTAQQEADQFRVPSNGKSSGKVFAGFSSEYNLPPDLEPI